MFAASVKVVTMIIALAGGGLNPISLILKNLVYTTLLVVLLYKVRKTFALTLFSAVGALVSFMLLGGGITTVPASILSALSCELLILLSGGMKDSTPLSLESFFTI